MSLRSELRQNPGDSIAEIARNVAIVFARGRAKQLEPHLRSELENELGRFKIWAGNLGVFAPGRASADYRLRDDADVKEVLIQMLDRLRQSTKQAMDPPVMLKEEEEESEPDDSSSTSSVDSMAISLDKDSDAGSEMNDVPSPQSTDVVANALSTIKDTITRLYRLSAIIKKPSSSNENVKVANFMAKEEDSEELREFQISVRWQIQFRLPSASPALLERLVDAAVFRRRKLEYRERHKEKLGQGVEPFFSELAVPLLPEDTVLRQVGAQHRSAAGLRRQGGLARSYASTLQYSATEASSVNRLKFASYPKSAALSGITKSAVARREQLDIPAPPSKSEEGLKEAVCPYCFRIVDKEDMVPDRWKRHILRDIEPYICLFDGCDKPAESFATVDGWINHMQWQHAIVWCCQVAGHEATVYHSEEDFKKHLRGEHKNAFNESQLSTIVKKGAQPTPDLFNSLAITLTGDENKPGKAAACPLCPFFLDISKHNPETNKLEVSITSTPGSKKMFDHIAAHMEAIALLSLPEREDLDDANTSERESENTHHSLDQDSKDLALAFPIIDTEDAEKQADDSESLHGFRKPGEWWGFVSMDDWNCILEDERVKSVQYIEPAQDPTLKEFVRRARRAEMFRRWKINKIPPIVVYDPDGMETRPVIDGTHASSSMDVVPRITVSKEENIGHSTTKVPVDRKFVVSESAFDPLAQAPSIVLHTPSGYSVTHEVMDHLDEASLEEMKMLRYYRHVS
ncbi:hypothetical protein DSL72_000252 [Monilinia vaccinii-corymbosi]|uniref:Uncharacterized protein n=1 Tax=Monilinia vaccinii-corymbosi TaxID=61207 RepID=A0A8A3P3W6_9HELO|nr:hypothetical protein DSL72_000252 [Monilinia vaccinii-corymbosi]